MQYQPFSFKIVNLEDYSYAPCTRWSSKIMVLKKFISWMNWFLSRWDKNENAIFTQLNSVRIGVEQLQGVSKRSSVASEVHCEEVRATSVSCGSWTAAPETGDGMFCIETSEFRWEFRFRKVDEKEGAEIFRQWNFCNTIECWIIHKCS